MAAVFFLYCTMPAISAVGKPGKGLGKAWEKIVFKGFCPERIVI